MSGFNGFQVPVLPPHLRNFLYGYFNAKEIQYVPQLVTILSHLERNVVFKKPINRIVSCHKLTTLLDVTFCVEYESKVGSEISRWEALQGH